MGQTSDGIEVSDGNQAVGVRERQGAKEQGVYYGKDRGVCSDAQRKDKNSGGSKARESTDRADAIAQILHEVLQPSDAAGVATFFFAFFDSAHFKKSLATGFFQRQTFGDVLFGLSLDVIPQFIIKFSICLSSAK